MLLVIIISIFQHQKIKKFFDVCVAWCWTHKHTLHTDQPSSDISLDFCIKLSLDARRKKSSRYILQLYMMAFLNKFSSFSFSNLVIKRFAYICISHVRYFQIRKSIDSHARILQLNVLTYARTNVCVYKYNEPERADYIFQISSKVRKTILPCYYYYYLYPHRQAWLFVFMLFATVAMKKEKHVKSMLNFSFFQENLVVV